MANYRHITLTWPSGERVITIVEDLEVNGELLRLKMLYRLKVKMGRRLSDKELARYPRVGLETTVKVLGPAKCRPLSAAFGRGSGGPV